MKKHIVFLFLGINFSAQAMLKDFKEIELRDSPHFSQKVLAYMPSEHVEALPKSRKSNKSIFIVPETYAHQENLIVTNLFLELLHAIPRERYYKVHSTDASVYDFRPFCKILAESSVCSSCIERRLKKSKKLQPKNDPKVQNNPNTQLTDNQACAIAAAYGIGCGLVGFGLGGTFAYLMFRGKT